MRHLKDLIAGYAQPGRLEWIGLRPARRADMLCVAAARITDKGLEGDHAGAMRRAVTLIQAEHLPVIGAMLGRDAVAADALRRNLVVSGLNLAALKGRHIQIGSAILEVTGICAPCSRMEEAFGAGGYSAVRGHGGMCAGVISSGAIAVGDTVQPLTSDV